MAKVAKKKAKKARKKSTSKKSISKPSVKKKGTAKKKVAKKLQGTCFVMMPFKSPFEGYYTTIFKPAIKAAKLEPIRPDDLFRPSAIVSDLWKMVQEAKVLLAELTTKNANVFYELGLAHAIGKPVILISETMDDVPFDLQQLRVILYDKDDPAWGDNLGKNITASLKETLASPIEAVPGIFRKKVESKAPMQDATLARIEALERDVRLFRRSPRLSKRISNSRAESELLDVHQSDELDSWVQKWARRGYAVADLLDMIVQADGIPGGEAERIRHKFSHKVGSLFE